MAASYLSDLLTQYSAPIGQIFSLAALNCPMVQSLQTQSKGVRAVRAWFTKGLLV